MIARRVRLDQKCGKRVTQSRKAANMPGGCVTARVMVDHLGALDLKSRGPPPMRRRPPIGPGGLSLLGAGVV